MLGDQQGIFLKDSDKVITCFGLHVESGDVFDS